MYRPIKEIVKELSQTYNNRIKLRSSKDGHIKIFYKSNCISKFCVTAKNTTISERAFYKMAINSINRQIKKIDGID